MLVSKQLQVDAGLTFPGGYQDDAIEFSMLQNDIPSNGAFG